ncbi:glycine-rich 2-like [Olea europaea subsp. europaea]|uniref:Glycine-rich 2-like n=1 Tax=Olea europaea subsp. europaea TaxID=158383 RepID=A0A8S0SWW4_OLEEU|nr:glycine-rich 2-like [Olea europaea subsp. europaea]
MFGFITPNGSSEDLFTYRYVIKIEGFRSLGNGENVDFKVEYDYDGHIKAAKMNGIGDGRGHRDGGGGVHGYNEGGGSRKGNGYGDGGYDGEECGSGYFKCRKIAEEEDI